MTNRIRHLTVAFGVIALLTAGSRVAAKPTGPVRIDVSPSTADMKTGDVVTATLTFTALDDISHLQVRLSVIVGLEILSDPQSVAFENVTTGESRNLQVQVRLTGEKYGDLSVLYRAIVRGKSSGGAVGVTFGNPKR